MAAASALTTANCGMRPYNNRTIHAPLACHHGHGARFTKGE
jgi:hypothetical protein